MARVLVIEDMESLLRLICRVLEEEMRHEAVGVRTLEDAKAATKSRVWDLVIADRILPDGDGREIIPLIPGVPVLTVSGEREAELLKPFSLEALEAAVRAKLAGA